MPRTHHGGLLPTAPPFPRPQLRRSPRHRGRARLRKPLAALPSLLSPASSPLHQLLRMPQRRGARRSHRAGELRRLFLGSFQPPTDVPPVSLEEDRGGRRRFRECIIGEGECQSLHPTNRRPRRPGFLEKCQKYDRGVRPPQRAPDCRRDAISLESGDPFCDDSVTFFSGLGKGAL